MSTASPHFSSAPEPAAPTSLSAPVVLVTGAAQRMGRAIALHLASQGWRVALHYRRSAAEAAQTLADLRAAGNAAQAFAADLADEAACTALPQQVFEAMGRLDAVVNNASLFEHDDLPGFSYGAMERHWRANTAPAIVLARALHSLLAPGRQGVVVNLLDHKLFSPNPDHLSYTLSKAALHSATTLLAQALAPRVRVCGVAPGLTMLSGDMNQTEFAAAAALSPLHRSNSPQDVAEAVAYLLQAGAVTGTTLLVDAGQHLRPQPRDVLFLAREQLAAAPSTESIKSAP